ncbi:MAG: DASS family sodium-coupled anion symporter [Desulfohalobiaceae bacterium]|nr:DASS family sodium-coupled anion symporter [Desulfohalobiaceae bacterium]
MHAADIGFGAEALPWWKNKPGYKPVLLLCGIAVFLFILLAPPPSSLLDLVQQDHPAGYKIGKGARTITDTVNRTMHPEALQIAQEARAQGKPVPAEIQEELLSPQEVARMAMVMIGILMLAAFFWGTETLPLGATDLMVAALMYLFFILPPDMIAKAFVKDSVIFIFGILTVAVGVSKTGLDKRIGLLLLSRIRSAKSFCFIFFPSLAICAGFLSEHALVALLIPVVMGVYKASCKAYGVEKDHALAVLLLLGMCFAANVGGPGSPAAGGRNAVMVGYLNEMNASISFTQWMIAGLPFVPVMALVIGIYMYLRCKPKFKVGDVNPAKVVREEVARLPKFGGQEALMAVILLLMVFSWIFLGKYFNLGGPTIMAVVAMFAFRILSWEDVQRDVAFDVVGLYAAATAMGAGLKFTGGALWLAGFFVNLMPDFLAQGAGLPLGVALLTGTLTNFMSDGATVSALGPIVLPMAPLTGVHIWKVGLACAFSSSFAHCLVVGTPNNAIAFGMGRDPDTGERLLDVMDFVKYGVPAWILSMLVLGLWTFLGYWLLIPWPAV